MQSEESRQIEGSAVARLSNSVTMPKGKEGTMADTVLFQRASDYGETEAAECL